MLWRHPLQLHSMLRRARKAPDWALSFWTVGVLSSSGRLVGIFLARPLQSEEKKNRAKRYMQAILEIWYGPLLSGMLEASQDMEDCPLPLATARSLWKAWRSDCLGSHSLVQEEAPNHIPLQVSLRHVADRCPSEIDH